MATIDGTTGPDDFANSPGDDFYVGHEGDDTLHMFFGSGQDNFYGGSFVASQGVDTVKFDGILFYVSYIADAFYDYTPLPDWDVGRAIGLTDGTRVSIVNHWYTGWTQFQALDTALLTHVYGAGATILGSAANEVIGGSSETQTIDGAGGNDVIYGNGGVDTVFGGAGFDYISAGLDDGANDRFDGGADNDIISYSGAGAVTIDLNAGVAYGASIGTDTLVSFEQAAGSQLNDVLIGSSGHNTFWGLYGNDYVYAGAGNDIAYGGAGVDVLQGEAGDDVLRGEDGQDYLIGGDGQDTLYGGDGVDVLYVGGFWNDVAYGEAGDDYFYADIHPGQTSGATVYGGEGNDIFVMSDDYEIAWGGAGQDYFYMGSGADQIHGGDGVDVMVGGTGDDRFDGGLGVDYLFLGGGGTNDADGVFVSKTDTGIQVVNQFQGGDFVQLSGTGWTSFSQVQAAITDYTASGGFCVLTIDADTSVWFIGVTPAQLQASNFLFS